MSDPSSSRVVAPLARWLGPELRAALRSKTLKVPALRRRGLEGLHASRLAGRGGDFREYRNYEPGDELRRIDWRASARRQQPVIPVRESLAQLQLQVLVDIGAGMNFGQGASHKYTRAAAKLSALVEMARAQGDRAQVLAATSPSGGGPKRRSGTASELHRAGPGRNTLWELDELLARGPQGSTDWPLLLAAAGQRRPALRLVFSDFLDFGASPELDTEILDALARGAHGGVPTWLIQILHPDEVEPPWRGGSQVRLEDLWGRRKTVRGRGEVLARQVRERVAAHLDWLEKACAERGLGLRRDLAQADTPRRLWADLEAFARGPSIMGLPESPER